jgi:hypothetical protein
MADRDPVRQPLPKSSGLGSGANVYSPRLLPFEKQLCEITGLNEAEYRFSVAEAYKHAKTRPAEYDLIPDINADAATLTALAISLFVGAASTAASYFLTPKPSAPQFQQQQGGGQLNLASIVGGQRFSPTFGFDSQADLAELRRSNPHCVWSLDWNNWWHLDYTETGVVADVQLRETARRQTFVCCR